MNRWRSVSIGLSIILALLVGWPLVATIVEAVTAEGSREGGSEISAPTGPAIQTILLVLGATAIAIPIGLIAAFLLFRTNLKGRRGLLGLVLIVLFVPMPLLATAWLGAFGNAGRSQAIGSAPILVGLPGAIFVHAMASLPWVIVIAGIGLKSVETELEESALMEMPAWKVALSVTLRRSIGAIFAAALAVAVLTAGDMTVTDLLQVRTYAEEAYLQFQANGATAAASVAIAPTIILGILVGLAARGLSRIDPSRLASTQNRSRTWRLGRWRSSISVLVWLTMGNLLALPIYGLFWRAGRVGGSAGHPPAWSASGLLTTLLAAFGDVRGPLSKSLIWAAIAATGTVVLAWPLAWLARRKGVWSVIALGVVALLFACPGPVVGLALVLTYNAPIPGPDAWLATKGLFEARVAVYDSMAIVAIAYSLRTLPYAVLVLWPVARGVPEAFVESASVDGLGPWGLARNVAWPLTKSATMAAWGVAFVLSIGELPATNLVEPPGHTMLVAKLLWSLLHTGVESHLAGVGLILIALIGAVGSIVGWSLSRTFGLGRDRDRDRDRD